MTPKLLHRAVALLLFLFALTHGLGMLADSGHGFVMAALRTDRERGD